MQHAANPVAPAATIAGVTQPPRIHTWHLYVALVVATLVLAWANREFVMTREVYHSLLGARLEASRIDENFDLMQQSTRWGYLSVPLLVWVRLALIALLVQLFFLLLLVEVPFRQVFRAAAWAYPALLYGMAVRMFMLSRLDPTTVTRDDLAHTPGSVAAFFPGVAETGTALYTLLSLLNFWELLWCVALFVALRRAAPRLTRGATLVTVGGVWMLCSFFVFGVTLYLTGVR